MPPACRQATVATIVPMPGDSSREVHGQARMVVFQLERHAVQGRDCLDQGEAQAAALRRSAAIEAIEAVEDLLALFRGNAGAIVGHFGFEAVRFRMQGEAYRA